MPGAKAVHYEYDAIGNRSLMIDPEGGRTTYSYDAASRLSSLRTRVVCDGVLWGHVTNIVVNKRERKWETVIVTLPNGTQEKWRWTGKQCEPQED